MVLNTREIFMRALLSYFFITLRRNDLEKKSPLSKFEILGAFVNTLAADDKYAVPDCENLRFPIQMELYQKRKFFRQFFVQFMESISIFKNFFEKKDRHS